MRGRSLVGGRTVQAHLNFYGTALSFERCFPDSVRGPQLIFALRRMASSFAAETVIGRLFSHLVISHSVIEHLRRVGLFLTDDVANQALALVG